MPFMPIFAAVLMATHASPFPEGFTAQCTGDDEAYVALDGRAILHPTIRRPASTPPVSPSEPVPIPGYIPPHGGTVILSYRRGQFSIELLGPDFDVMQTSGKQFKLSVLKASPGDLALSVETDSRGRSLTVYHLRYAGRQGALTVSRTSYAGHGSDDTSLMAMSCKIHSQPVP